MNTGISRELVERIEPTFPDADTIIDPVLRRRILLQHFLYHDSAAYVAKNCRQADQFAQLVALFKPGPRYQSRDVFDQAVREIALGVGSTAKETWQAKLPVVAAIAPPIGLNYLDLCALLSPNELDDWTEACGYVCGDIVRLDANIGSPEVTVAKFKDVPCALKMYAASSAFASSWPPTLVCHSFAGINGRDSCQYWRHANFPDFRHSMEVGECGQVVVCIVYVNSETTPTLVDQKLLNLLARG